MKIASLLVFLLLKFTLILTSDVGGTVLRRQKRVINGRTTRSGEFPFLVQLVYNPRLLARTISPRVACGATIVTRQHVLTAAHCFNNEVRWFTERKYQVVAGTKCSDATGGIRYDIDTYYTPNEYEMSTDANDIAVVKLMKKIRLIRNLIAVAILPFRDVAYNTRAEVAGWGKDSSGDSPRVLKKLSAVVISKEACAQDYDLSILLRRNDCMCAHTNRNVGFGIDEGDSGGGLYQGDVVIGIISSTFGVSGTFPDEYTIIFKHRAFILDKLAL